MYISRRGNTENGTLLTRSLSHTCWYFYYTGRLRRTHRRRGARWRPAYSAGLIEQQLGMQSARDALLFHGVEILT